MTLTKNNFTLEVKADSIMDSLAINALVKRSTTYRDVKIRGRMSTVEDKKFFIHNKKNDIYTFHINQLDDILESLKDNGVSYTIVDKTLQDIKRTPTKLKVKDGFDYRDDVQRGYAAFLAEGRNTALCTIETGGGKTGSTIMYLLKEKNPGKILILTAPRYYNIWEDAIVKFTTIKKDEIYVTSGRESLLSLLDNHDKAEMILLSPSTWRDYMKSYNGLDRDDIDPAEFLKQLGIDTVVIDEAHEDFAGNYLGILGLNPTRYIVLTATYTSRYDSGKVSKFKRYFVPDRDRLPVSDFNKFINIVFCQYRLEDPARIRFINAMGFYNHTLYEESLCKSRTRLYRYFEMILFFINEYYDNKHRLLILFATKIMCKEFHYYVKKNKSFGSKKVATKIEGDIATDAYNAQVIISTGKSSGTGVDIQSLQCTVNTIAVRSDGSSIQFKGRNREMESVEQYYLSLSCANIAQHQVYKKSNIIDFTNKSKGIKTNYYSANI